MTNLGYVVVFVDNNSIGTDVWFDNVQISHFKGQVLEENHYYPFGLTLIENSNNPALPKQLYKYQGIELERNFGLESYETFYRGLDPQIGRFNSIDPKAELDYSLSPYVSMRNNPAFYTDPFGDVPGDFLDENGKVVGNDGINDGKVYVVKTTETNFGGGMQSAGITKEQQKETLAFIKENSGSTSAFTGNSIAYDNSVEIESSSVTRQEMVDIVSKDNGKGGTSDANNREYGGTISNDGKVTPMMGPVSNPKTSSHASIEFTIDENTRAIFHGHPSGEIEEGPAPQNGNVGSSSNIDMGGGTRTKYSYNQAPSSVDFNHIGNLKGYQFGRSNGTVYIYNSSGIQATLPMKRFVNPKK
ncbi:hypothetical protein D3C86_869210 [compost metagenome]